MANLGFGVDPASSLDRAVLGTELALSPFAVKEAAKFGPTAQRILNLGLSIKAKCSSLYNIFNSLL